jgi:hypothetical protein
VSKKGRTRRLRNFGILYRYLKVLNKTKGYSEIFFLLPYFKSREILFFRFREEIPQYFMEIVSEEFIRNVVLPVFNCI